MLSTIFEVTAYPILLILVISWFVSLLKIHTKESALDWVKTHRIAVLFCAVLTFCTFISMDREFRTLSDEPNIISVSQSFYNTKVPRLVVLAKHYYNRFIPIEHIHPNRPLVFPFVLSLVHSIFGYDYLNAFYFNTFCLLLLLLLGYQIGFSILRSNLALVVPLAIVAQPIISISANSAGFDLFSALAVLYCVWRTKAFWDSPDKEQLNHLAISMLLMAQVRYENVLYLGVIGLFMLMTKKITVSSIFEIGPRIYLYPLFLIPSILQRLLSKAKDYQVPEDTTIFGFKHLFVHTKNIFVAFADLTFVYPYAAVMSILVVALLIFIFIFHRQKLSTFFPDTKFNRLCGVLAALYLLTILAYFFGRPLHPASARYFILACIGFSIAFPILVRIAGIPNSLNVLLTASIFVLYNPVAVEHNFIDRLTINRETGFEYKFLEKTNFTNPVIITERPGHFVILQKAAIGFGYARKYKKELQTWYERKLFTDFLVFQRMEYASGAPKKEDRMPEEFVLETIEEIQTSADVFVRISKVVGLNPRVAKPAQE